MHYGFAFACMCSEFTRHNLTVCLVIIPVARILQWHFLYSITSSKAVAFTRIIITNSWLLTCTKANIYTALRSLDNPSTPRNLIDVSNRLWCALHRYICMIHIHVYDFGTILFWPPWRTNPEIASFRLDQSSSRRNVTTNQFSELSFDMSWFMVVKCRHPTEGKPAEFGGVQS